MKLTYGKLRQIISEEIHRLMENNEEDIVNDIVRGALRDKVGMQPPDEVYDMTREMLDFFKTFKESNPEMWPPPRLSAMNKVMPRYEDVESFGDIYKYMTNMPTENFDMNYGR